MSEKIKISNISKEDLQKLTERIQHLYLSDKIPWVVGYSGGKDSTATLQLIWHSISELKLEEQYVKPIHIISSDTFVDSPIVATWLRNSLDKMVVAAEKQGLPIHVHRLTPDITDTFWVNLIGKGYPSPRLNFRWCTDRLKIRPSNNFITNVVAEHGEVILVLGTRVTESSSRAIRMKKYERMRVREWLSPSKKLINSLIFTPIEYWDNDDVWIYLMKYDNPWEQSNRELLDMYKGASTDGECPLVVDTDTPSCGGSRFGCWVCTIIKEDKSMQAMIQNDDEKEWMQPLLEFRNRIGNTDDRDKRDFRRMSGKVMIFNNRAVHGPYTKYWREEWLRQILKIEKQIKYKIPKGFENYRIISDDELKYIRKIWVLEKHEFDDSLPKIYEEVTGQEYRYYDDIKITFGKNEWDLLKEVCGQDESLFELQTNLLNITQQYMRLVRRKGILQELEEAVRRCYYTNEEDAVELASRKIEREVALKAEADLRDLVF